MPALFAEAAPATAAAAGTGRGMLILATVLTAAALVYLGYAMIRPERF